MYSFTAIDAFTGNAGPLRGLGNRSSTNLLRSYEQMHVLSYVNTLNVTDMLLLTGVGGSSAGTSLISKILRSNVVGQFNFRFSSRKTTFLASINKMFIFVGLIRKVHIELWLSLLI